MDRPLLVDGVAADPPIDDDDYNYEVQKFPTSVQIHLIYSLYTLGVFLSRTWEAACPMLIALCYSKNYIMVSIYAAAFAVFGPLIDKMARQRVLRHPRFRLMRNTIIQHRLSLIFASILLSYVSTFRIDGVLRNLALALIVALIVIGRVGTSTQLIAIENDWTHIMSNEQSGVCDTIVGHLKLVSLASSMVGPLVAGGLIYWLGVQNTLKVLQFALGLSLIVELWLMFQLYSTCYALSVPRPPQTDPFTANMGSIIPGITARKVVQYIFIKPKPVLCALGVILLKSTLVCVGPQFLFYFLNTKQMPAPVVGGFISLQIAAYMLPYAYGWLAALCIDVATIASVGWMVWYNYPWCEYAIAICIIVTRYNLHVLDQSAQWYIEDLVNDKAVLVLFRKAEVHALRVLDCLTQCLTLVWYKPDQFAIPVVVSGVVAVIGLALFGFARKL